ncbi:MAG: hypothetical protein H7Y11_07180 [Armatimonadetes bacterium]|nr:hypothetical protein [Anaerolineae bacterium]
MMRQFVTLDQVVVDSDTGMLNLVAGVDADSELRPRLSLRREGGFVAISVGSGPLEMALRPRHEDLARTLGNLHAVNGLQTTRQVGTGQAYLAFGLRDDGALVIRPTIVADATGHLSFNLLLTDEARKALFSWLPVTVG